VDEQCPNLPAGDNGSHYWIPKRVSSYRGEPQYEMRCKHCGITQKEWREQ
jgi:hypothetical protein